MPELPEVEIIRTGLEKKTVGLTLKNIQVLNPKIVQGNPKEGGGKPFDYAQGLRGRKVLKVWRRAKMLGIDLEENTTLLFHLKMTGQLIFVGEGERLIGGHPTEDMRGQMPNKSTVVIFTFENKEASGKLYFNDQRRFGWVKVLRTDEIGKNADELIGRVGPEPLEKEFTWQVMKDNLLKHRNLPVKVAIMDQSAIAGVGNIYASESLFLAKIDPRRKVSSLSDEEFQKLHDGIIESLQTSIKHGGSTRAHFVNVEGSRGYFLDFANVYGKAGQPCKGGCMGKVERMTQAGRGTFFCPSCQK